jgi:hypothetical protein
MLGGIWYQNGTLLSNSIVAVQGGISIMGIHQAALTMRATSPMTILTRM